mmetsp:Transcript_15727/g.35392  ORF Transcript_15727/g.35392 Transcript_15727/m.35392 type:complete len:85 (+) Transcript_15727:1473-1727(+)
MLMLLIRLLAQKYKRVEILQYNYIMQKSVQLMKCDAFTSIEKMSTIAFSSSPRSCPSSLLYCTKSVSSFLFFLFLFVWEAEETY